MRMQSESPGGTTTLAGYSLVFLAALVVLGHDLPSETHYMDESAFISQSFYFDLFVGGDVDDPRWIEFPALDHPPLAKYLIGLALRVGTFPRPTLRDAMAWYKDQSYRPETPAALIAARRPIVVFGALGCVAVFQLGVLAHGPRTGALAVLFLLLNPLYCQLSRRAMADAPAEALVLLTTAVGVSAWRRTMAGGWGCAPWLWSALGTGALGGLAVSAKLNGVAAVFAVGALAALSFALKGFGRVPSRVAAAAIVSGIAACATFVLVNPFVTARPDGPLPGALEARRAAGVWGRTVEVFAHRMRFSRDMQKYFENRALRSPRAKLKAVIARGYGRYSPLGRLRPGAARRYDRFADRWAWVWGPWILLGAAAAAARGYGQWKVGEPPTAWAVLSCVAVTFATITSLIPMDYDRYYLPLQSGAALLSACASVELAAALRRVPYHAGVVRRSLGVAVACGLLGLLAHSLRPAARHGDGSPYLSDFPWTSAANGWGPVERDLSNGEKDEGDGVMLSLRGQTYAKGLGVHAGSDIRFFLGGAFSTFRSDIGVDDDTGGAGSVIFQVWADGRMLYDSGRLTGDSSRRSLALDISGCRELRLVVLDGGDGNHLDHADWAGARLAPSRPVPERGVDGAGGRSVSSSLGEVPVTPDRKSGPGSSR